MVGSRHRKSSTRVLFYFDKGGSTPVLLNTRWMREKIFLEGIVKEVAALWVPDSTLTKSTLCYGCSRSAHPSSVLERAAQTPWVQQQLFRAKGPQA